jgi:hypothetical protein
MNPDQTNWMNGLLDCWMNGRQREAAHPLTQLSSNPKIHLFPGVHPWFNSVNA